jgi:predicted NACHT family NTPase
MLLKQAQQEEHQVIPVVLNLSSWTAKREKLEDWLVRQLKDEYSVPLKQAQRWIDNDNLLLLLDALDEVTEGNYDSCVEAINAYCRHTRRVVVCCRTELYYTLKTRVNRSIDVLIDPLTQEQIDEALAGDAFSGLRSAIEVEPPLQIMTRSPFLLNTMLYVYQDKKLEGVMHFKKYLSKIVG